MNVGPNQRRKYGSTDNSVITVPPVSVPPPEEDQLIQWMPQPLSAHSMQGCPPGLEYLAHLDQILVHKQAEHSDFFSLEEPQNRYHIKNAIGEQVYFAFEESDSCTRQCCGPDRDFIMHIVDRMNQEVIRVVRPFQCCAGYCWCADCCDDCALTLSVEAPPSRPIGYVCQRASQWEPHFDIQDHNLKPTLKIQGPLVTSQSVFNTGDVEFRLLSYDESEQIGIVSKHWTGFTTETFTKSTNFGMKFPKNLDVKVKGTLLGALFLIDFMFYERKRSAYGNAM